MEVAKASHVTAAVRKATSPETAQVVVVAEVEEVDMAAEGPTCAEISRRATVAMVTDADSSTERMMTEGKAAGEEVEEECADSTKVDTAPTEIVADSPTVMEATQAEETEAEVDVEEVMSATTAAKLAISQETAQNIKGQMDSRGGGGRRGQECYKCGRMGHKSYQCRDNYNSRDRQGGDRKRGVCY